MQHSLIKPSVCSEDPPQGKQSTQWAGSTISQVSALSCTGYTKHSEVKLVPFYNRHLTLTSKVPFKCSRATHRYYNIILLDKPSLLAIYLVPFFTYLFQTIPHYRQCQHSFSSIIFPLCHMNFLLIALWCSGYM